MLKIYTLISSIMVVIAADRDNIAGILSTTVEIIKTAAGSINPYTAGGEFYANDCISGMIAFAGTACLFGFCPTTPIGALIAGISMLLGGWLLEVLVKLVKNQEINDFEIFARHMSKSIGSGLYVLLSSIPNAAGIVFAVGVLYTTLVYYSSYSYSVPECMTITGVIFVDLLSFRWISGNCTLGFHFVMSIMLLMIFIVNFTNFVKYNDPDNFKRSLIALILFVPSLFVPKNPFFLLITTIWFQNVSWRETHVYLYPLYQGRNHV